MPGYVAKSGIASDPVGAIKAAQVGHGFVLPSIPLYRDDRRPADFVFLSKFLERTVNRDSAPSTHFFILDGVSSSLSKGNPLVREN